MVYRSVVLVILDGWGIAPAWGGNAIAQARTPTIDQLMRGPQAILEASGTAVGLAAHTLGNSEVGHLNLGAGRIVKQESERISQLIKSGQFAANSVLSEFLARLKQQGGRLHLAGLLSPARVHAARDHLVALLKLAQTTGLTDVRLHVFLDGRDADPQDGLSQVIQLEESLAKLNIGQIQTLIGRSWAMDRDNHWDKTTAAYQLIAFGAGRTAATSRAGVSQAYARGETDEFVPATVIAPSQPAIYRGLSASDGLIFWNFRADRARQLALLLAQTDLDKVSYPRLAQPIPIISLTPYGADRPLANITPAFPPPPLADTLAEVISREGLQFHIAESEKYAHITYFFNGRRETPFPGEKRQLIASPSVKSYDLIPEMSLKAVRQAILKRLATSDDRLIIANFANPDMIGHTGDYRAALAAVEAVDAALGELVRTTRKIGVPLVVTADHGNIEQMVNPSTGEPATDHTANPVPCWLALSTDAFLLRPRGVLADVAPTILDLLEIEAPQVMTGQSLLKRKEISDKL